MHMNWLTRRHRKNDARVAGGLRYRASAAVASVGHGDKVVLLDLRSEQYYSLDDVGAKIWQLMADTPSSEEIAAKLAEAYDAPADTIREDVNLFVSGLVRDRLIEEV